MFHLYVIRVPRRDELLDALKRAGVSAGVHYPLPLHRQPAFERRAAAKVSLPVTEAAVSTLVNWCGSCRTPLQVFDTRLPGPVSPH